MIPLRDNFSIYKCAEPGNAICIICRKPRLLWDFRDSKPKLEVVVWKLGFILRIRVGPEKKTNYEFQQKTAGKILSVWTVYRSLQESLIQCSTCTCLELQLNLKRSFEMQTI